MMRGNYVAHSLAGQGLMDRIQYVLRQVGTRLRAGLNVQRRDAPDCIHDRHAITLIGEQRVVAADVAQEINAGNNLRNRAWRHARLRRLFPAFISCATSAATTRCSPIRVIAWRSWMQSGASRRWTFNPARNLVPTWRNTYWMRSMRP